MSENYYNRSRVLDREGNFLHFDTTDHNTHIVRESSLLTVKQDQDQEEFYYYEIEKEKEQKFEYDKKSNQVI